MDILDSKIVVSAHLAGRLLQVLKTEKEEIEEKLLDLEMQIEEIENSIKTPLEPLVKKKDDFALTATRVETLVSRQSGLDVAGYTQILCVDLNLDATNKDLMKRLKGATYAHLWALKKKDKVMTEYMQESASTVYYPKGTDINPPKITANGVPIQ